MDLEQKVLGVLNKAIHSDPAHGHTIRQYIKEDLEAQAHNQLYEENDYQEMVMLKILPRTMASQTLHDFTRVTDYGNVHSGTGFSENALPVVNDFDGEKDQIKLIPHGTVTQVTGLAELEETISVMGKTKPSQQNEVMARLNFLYKMNMNLYGSDSRLSHNPYKIEGIYQQIDSKTRASGATSPDSEFVIDLRGKNISIEGTGGLRQKSTDISSKFHGKLRWLVMAGSQRTKIEEQLDEKSRLYIRNAGTKNERLMLGNTISGMTTDAGDMMFATDNILAKHVKTGFANIKAIGDAPAAFSYQAAGAAGTFEVAVVAQAAHPTVTSKWEGVDCRNSSAVIGDGGGATKLKVVYHIEALNDKGASIRGVSTTVEVDPTNLVEITIVPRGGETSFKLYRGVALKSITGVPTQDSDYLFKPEYIAEFKNGASKDNTTAFTVLDDNDTIAGTTSAFAMNIMSNSSMDFANKAVPTNVRSNSIGTNAFVIAQLTNLFKFDLAKVNWLADYSLLAWVMGLECTRPFHNVCYINCGRKQIVGITY